LHETLEGMVRSGDQLSWKRGDSTESVVKSKRRNTLLSLQNGGGGRGARKKLQIISGFHHQMWFHKKSEIES